MFKRALLYLAFLCFGVNSIAQDLSPAITYSAGTRPMAIAQGDFNGDGNVDLIVANAQSSSLSFFAGKGDGTFAPAVNILLSGSPNSLAVADFNGDGRLDIAVSYTTATGLVPDLQILYGNGDGTFQLPVTLHQSVSGAEQFGMGKIIAADVNGDGRPDLVAALNELTVFLNEGAGRFTQSATAIAGTDVEDFVVADLNNDGRLDIAALAMSTGSTGVSGQLFLAHGKGDGSFDAPSPLPFITMMPGGIAAADLNQDGRIDLVLCDYGQVSQESQSNGSIEILLQQPDGSFVTAGALTAVANPWRAVVADFDGDGRLDVATLSMSVPGLPANTPNAVIVYPGNGDGTFAAPNQFALTSSPWDLITESSSNAKAPDLAILNAAAGTLSVLVNHSSPVQAPPTPTPSPAQPESLAVAVAATTSNAQSSGAVATPFTITSSLNPSVYGQAVTLTATGDFTCQNCTSAPGPPSGTITFYDGGAIIGSVNLFGAGTTLATSALNAGNHSITVQFSSTNPSFGSGSGGPMAQVVNQSSTSTSVSSSVNPSVYGQEVTFAIGVSAAAPGTGTPTGSVLVLDGGTNIGTAALSGGQASFPISILAVGQNNIVASYEGDHNFKPSTSSTIAQVVNKSSTATSVASSVNPSVYGQPVTFTDTESVVTPGAGLPTGALTFLDGTTDLDATTLSGGRAVFTISTLSVGGHSVTAVYAGDSDFNGSDSSAVVQIVNKSQTSIFIASSANPSVYGQAVTLTAMVSAVTPGAGMPTGSVTVLDGTTSLGSFNLNSGLASVTLSTPMVGVHNITASYSGDDNFESSSAIFTQTVDKASAAITASSSLNPSTYDQSVALTVAVGAVAPGTGTPTGNVMVSDHGVNLGTVSVNGGQATLTLATLAAGSHAFVVSYSGDNNFNPATDAFAQTVSKAATSVSVSSSLNPAVVGQTVTFTANVTVASPGSGAPTGTITFLDGGASIGSAAVSSGQATFTTSTLVGGSHVITASYSGDGNFVSSTSPAMEQTVNVPDFAIAVTTPQGTVTAGDTFKTGIQLTPAYGFTGTVNLTCSADIPQGSCSITPASGKLDGHDPLAATVTVQTAGSSTGAAAFKRLALHGVPVFAVAIFGLPIVALRRRKRGLALLLGAAMFAVGCGSGGGSTGSHPTPAKSTPSATYTITVQAQSGSLTHSGQIALVVN